MSSELHASSSSAAPQAVRSVPRAAWIGGGLLSLVAAGAAGAFLMRAADHPTVQPTDAAVHAAGKPVPLVAAPVAKPEHRVSKAPATGSSAGTQTNAPTHTRPAALCANCGVVESVHAVQHKGEGTGLGAVAGGVLGGVVGHQIGGGDGKKAMTVIGAVGGGLAGHEIEKRARSTTVFDVQVRMQDGSTRSFQQSQSLAVGAQVVVEGNKLHLARDNNAGDTSPMVRTSAPANGRT
jgi:outer membrane lipoprotein SlyB